MKLYHILNIEITVFYKKIWIGYTNIDVVTKNVNIAFRV